MTRKQEAAALRRTIALKGQSRSTFCGTLVKGSVCRRLTGHKGTHRPTLQREPKAAPKAVEAKVVEPTIIPEAPEPSRVQPVSRKARRPKAAPKVAAER